MNAFFAIIFINIDMDIWSKHICLIIDKLDIDLIVCMRLTIITPQCEYFLMFQILEAVVDFDLATNERREKANSYQVWFNAQLMLNRRVN